MQIQFLNFVSKILQYSVFRHIDSKWRLDKNKLQKLDDALRDTGHRGETGDTGGTGKTGLIGPTI